VLQVPADVRLIKVTDMTVDNSNLTGEGDPQQRAIETNNPGVLEADNLAFMGTTVMGGKGVGVIIARGNVHLHTSELYCSDMYSSVCKYSSV
jgi:magnesium-transporting ATPase (P-type)